MALTMGAVMLAVVAVMEKAEARAMATTVMLLVVSSGGNGSNGTTTNVCNAILPQYTDVVDVGSNNDCDCTPAIVGDNIDRSCQLQQLRAAHVRGLATMAGRGQQNNGEGGGGGRKRKHSKANGGGGN